MDRLSKIFFYFKKSSILNKIAKRSYNISTWDDLIKNFGNDGSMVKNIWEKYVLSSNNHRDSSVRSMIEAYRGENIPSEPHVLSEESNVVKNIKNILSKNNKQNLSNIDAEKNVYTEKVDNKSKLQGIFGGLAPNWITNSHGSGYTSGPLHHTSRSGRALTGWESDNAWDALAPIGTPVYSITNGTVISIKKTNSSRPNIYGSSVKIRGDDNFPDVFYTHIDSIDLSVGDKISIGDYIGMVAEPKVNTIPPHAHIGISNGQSISSLINQNGSFKYKV
jgi:murein DD-endopeptidase MepM/ murein hydrolase activator NlpD